MPNHYSLQENINPQAVHSITHPDLMCSLMNKHISGADDRPFIFDVLSLAFFFLVNIHACIGLITAAASPPGRLL